MKYNSSTTEKLFQSHIEMEKINISRTMCLLGAFLYTVLALVDYYSLSVSILSILLVRGFIISLLLAVFAYSYHESFIKQYDLLFLSVYVLAAAGIEAIIYLAPSSDHAPNIYLAGLVLIIMTIFTWSYLKIWNALIASMLIVSSYLFLGLYKNFLLSDLFVNAAFLFSATGIGFISQINRDEYLKQNFLLQRSLELLENKVKEKTNEANHDGLTGLANRRYICVLLEQKLQKVIKSKDKTLAIMFIDLNKFKEINDTHGHYVGDKVLTIVARRLELAVRKDDCVGRLGGDEYLIGLVMRKNQLLKIQNIAEKFTRIISAPIRINELKFNISASVGVALYPNHGSTISGLIDSADKEMYFSKHGKKEMFREKINEQPKIRSNNNVLSIVKTD